MVNKRWKIHEAHLQTAEPAAMVMSDYQGGFVVEGLDRWSWFGGWDSWFVVGYLWVVAADDSCDSVVRGKALGLGENLARALVMDKQSNGGQPSGCPS